MKQAMQRGWKTGAKGVKLQLSGRLRWRGNGPLRKGHGRRSIPLSTRCGARSSTGSPKPATPQGNIGIKAWVNQGDYLTGEIAERRRRVCGGRSSKSGVHRSGRRRDRGGDRGGQR